MGRSFYFGKTSGWEVFSFVNDMIAFGANIFAPDIFKEFLELFVVNGGESRQDQFGVGSLTEMVSWLTTTGGRHSTLGLETFSQPQFKFSL